MFCEDLLRVYAGKVPRNTLRISRGLHDSTEANILLTSFGLVYIAIPLEKEDGIT